jgi:hypothetical protein
MISIFKEVLVASTAFQHDLQGMQISNYAVDGAEVLYKLQNHTCLGNLKNRKEKFIFITKT